MQMPRPPDQISLSSLQIHLFNGLGPSAFNLTPPPPCPITLDLALDLHPSVVPLCVISDTMSGLGLNYSTLSKTIYAALTGPGIKFGSPLEVLNVVREVIGKEEAVIAAEVKVGLSRGLLHASSVEYVQRFDKLTRTRGGDGESAGKEVGVASAEARHRIGAVKCTIKDMKLACVIGLHPHERAERQRLETDITVMGMGERWSHKLFADEALDYLEKSSFGTLESLIDTLAKHLLTSSPYLSSPASTIDITIRKPCALPFAIPSIRIQRSSLDFTRRSKSDLIASLSTSQMSLHTSIPTLASTSTSSSTARTQVRQLTMEKRVFIAVGSNIGDRVGHIRRAVKELEAGGCKLKDCSRLYESEPMYVTDQDRFINGVIEVSTSLPPLDLLRLLKRTERSVGRIKTFTNGPRVIDLDLILYGDEEVVIGSRDDVEDEDGVRWLECPHPASSEREFVLRPLADIAPTLIHPTHKITIQSLLTRLESSSSSPPQLCPIIPFPSPSLPLRLSAPSLPSTPYIMAIFNATPDSFSDGHPSRIITSSALASVSKLTTLPSPPSIIDIGGMSTRPNSTPCTEEEEIDRVIPLVKAIRAADPPLSCSILSIDTYRPSVARKAIQAGASCINDVRGGSEPGMLETMAELDCPVILMHSRGDSTTMTESEAQNYEAFGGVVNGVRAELEASVQRALEAGVKRWNIIVDPGLGFAKTFKDNLVLLKHLPQLVEPRPLQDRKEEDDDGKEMKVDLSNFPMLVGASRKGFVGTVSGRKVAAERGYADAAVDATCVASGVVDILRVHDPLGASDAVKMAAAIRDA